MIQTVSPWLSRIVPATCLTLAAGCGALNAAESSFENAAGRAAGDRAAQAAFGQPGTPAQGNSSSGGGPGALGFGMGPQFQAMYTQLMFQLAFSSGGMEVSQVPFQPGQFVRWQYKGAEDNGKVATIERAYLFDDSDHNQWWKVKYATGEKNETIVLEALLSKDGHKVLRMRGQFPGEQPHEMAVDESTQFVPPTRLTAQSLQGATVGTEKVATPAGAFTARHVVFGDPARGTYEWWLVDAVPGGVVKIATKHEGKGGEQVLVAHGGHAESELGVKP